MIVYLDGAYLNAGEAHVSLFDAGYLYGDGLFETLRLYGGSPFDLPGHLSRLQRQLDLLGYDCHLTSAEVSGILDELLTRNELTGQDARARLTVSRGGRPGELLPVADLEQLPPTISICVTPLPPELEGWQQYGISVKVMTAAFARGNFPQLKSLNYLPSLLALRFAAARDCQEAILVNRQGKLLEGATSNIFLVTQGIIRTPPPRLGLLAGRTRSLTLVAAGNLGYRCEELACDRRDLFTADEIFLTSSVREVVPVVRIDGTAVSGGQPGYITRALQKQYRQDVANALAAGSA